LGERRPAWRWWLCALAVSAGCAGSLNTVRAEPPVAAPPARRGSDELQALARSEAARFAHAVEVEQASTRRAPFEAVSETVVVDRSRGLVYVLGPELTALDLSTGAVRWSKPEAEGTSLHRVGEALVVVGTAQARRSDRYRDRKPPTPVLWFVSLSGPRAGVDGCALTLPVPATADVVAVTPFDRAGVPYVYFASSARPHVGGQNPGDHERQRVRAAISCGVVELELATCATRARPVEPFLLDPPRDFGAGGSIAPTDCEYLSPGQAMPAVAASQLPAASSAPWPRVSLVRTPLPVAAGECEQRTSVTLEVTHEGATKPWTHALPGESSRVGCGGPP
jgi:hypothetical protein